MRTLHSSQAKFIHPIFSDQAYLLFTSIVPLVSEANTKVGIKKNNIKKKVFNCIIFFFRKLYNKLLDY